MKIIATQTSLQTKEQMNHATDIQALTSGTVKVLLMALLFMGITALGVSAQGTLSSLEDIGMMSLYQPYDEDVNGGISHEGGGLTLSSQYVKQGALLQMKYQLAKSQDIKITLIHKEGAIINQMSGYWEAGTVAMDFATNRLEPGMVYEITLSESEGYQESVEFKVIK